MRFLIVDFESSDLPLSVVDDKRSNFGGNDVAVVAGDDQEVVVVHGHLEATNYGVQSRKMRRKDV